MAVTRLSVCTSELQCRELCCTHVLPRVPCTHCTAFLAALADAWPLGSPDCPAQPLPMWRWASGAWLTIASLPTLPLGPAWMLRPPPGLSQSLQLCGYEH